MSIVYLLKKEGIVNIKPLDSNQIKTIAKNEYNSNYWRTFWNALQYLN